TVELTDHRQDERPSLAESFLSSEGPSNIRDDTKVDGPLDEPSYASTQLDDLFRLDSETHGLSYS
ncbi:hypothetical protein HAX54_000257, partial [Datura stramonium]|nr:hypothetical protein [Datura stramonium]